jgi:hypothetical protein
MRKREETVLIENDTNKVEMSEALDTVVGELLEYIANS